MTRTSKFILRFLCACAALVIIAIIAFIVWRVNLAHEVNAKLAAIRAVGLPTNGKELNAYYPAVPNNENAALVMTQAFALMRNFSDSRSNDVLYFKTLPRGQPLTSKQKQIFADYIKMNSAELATMREAIKLPKNRYPVDYTPGPNTLLLHLSKLHKLSEIVRYESLLAGESGDTTNAVASIENLLGMAHTLDEEPDIIAQLVRISFIAMAKNSLEHCLNVTNLNESELAGLASTFSSAEKTNLMVRALVGDRADHIPVFQSVRFSDVDLLYFLNVMETNIALDNFLPPKNLAVADNFKKAEKIATEKHYYLSKLLLPIPNVIIDEAKFFACLRTSIAAIAVERFRLAHGQLPQSLNELVPQFLSAVPIDPFDGKPLRYHRLAKGYVIYSIGADGHDDGGKEKPADWKSGDKTPYDITFTVER